MYFYNFLVLMIKDDFCVDYVNVVVLYVSFLYGLVGYHMYLV